MTAYDPLSQVKLKLFFNVLQYATLGTNLIYIEIRPLGGTNIYTGYFNLTTAPSFMLDMEGQYGVMNLDFPYLLYTSLYNPSTGVYTAPPGIPGSLSLFTMVIVPIALAYTQEPEYVTSYYINVGTISGTQVFGFTMQVDFAV
jgi:hypothetical protein